MRGAGAEARRLAVVIACEDMEIAAAEGEPEIERRPGGAHVEAAQMHQRTIARRGCELAIERRMARGCEQVRYAHARERLALLLHKQIESQRELGAGVRVDELDRAKLAEALELGAIAAPGRGRAL